jgi:hypothetical protein
MDGVAVFRPSDAWYASANGEKLFVYVTFTPRGDGLAVVAPIAGLDRR